MKRIQHSAACQRLGPGASNADVYKVCQLCRERLHAEGYRPRKNPGERLTGTKMKGRVDYTAARELFLFIQNDQQLYRQEQAIDANLRRKLKRGVFRKDLAVKLFMYLADAGARKYIKDYFKETLSVWRLENTFNKKTRFAVAAMLTKYWIDARRDEGVHVNPDDGAKYYTYLGSATRSRCDCERESCDTKHIMGGCSLPAAHRFECFGEKINLCRQCVEDSWFKRKNPISRNTAHRISKYAILGGSKLGWIENPPKQGQRVWFTFRGKIKSGIFLGRSKHGHLIRFGKGHFTLVPKVATRRK